MVRADVATVRRFQAESDLRAMGYWRWLWADLSTGAKVTDASRGEFALSLNPKGFGKHFPFYFENAVAALDCTGEWVLDRNTGILHAILPRGTKQLVLTSFSKPFVSLEGVRYVAFKGICFRYGRGDCMRIRNSEHVAIVGCTVQAFGNRGIAAADSRFVSVKGSKFSDFGTTALDFAGGNRRTLEPSDYLLPTTTSRGLGIGAIPMRQDCIFRDVVRGFFTTPSMTCRRVRCGWTETTSWWPRMSSSVA